jgi:hypothetical protein
LNRIELLIQTLRMYKKLKRSLETLEMVMKEVCCKLPRTAKMNHSSGRRMSLLSLRISTQKSMDKAKV